MDHRGSAALPNNHLTHAKAANPPRRDLTSIARFASMQVELLHF
jgi:hypothetical protein